MTVKELRIGNLILINGKQTEIIHLVCDDDYSHFEPIPLTEEWLVRAGFEFDKIDGYWYIDEYWRYFFEGDVCFLGNFSHAVDYVHQLQNLYFALTGEELNFANVK